MHIETARFPNSEEVDFKQKLKGYPDYWGVCVCVCVCTQDNASRFGDHSSLQ